MTIPDVTNTITDGALGIIEVNTRQSAKIGCCSGGVANTVYSFNDQKTLKDTLGTGPLVEATAHTLAVSGGTVLCVKGTGSTAGSAGSVTHTGTGVCVVSTSGTPVDLYQVIVTITRAGTNPAAGTAAMTISLDGGDTVSGEISVPTSGSYVLSDTGVTLAFTAASLVVGDTYTFSTVAPALTSGDIASAWAALVADSREWKFVHIVGSAATASGQATLCGVVDALLTAAETAFRYTYAIMECPELGDGTAGDAGLQTAFASFTTRRMEVCAAQCELTSASTGRVHRRSSGWVEAANRQGALVHEDSGRVASGARPGVTKLWRDEQVTSALDALQFTTLRSFTGRKGFYVTQGRIMAPTGSDFRLVQYREVMDVACRIARDAAIQFLNEGVRTNPSDATPAPGQPGAPSTIDERDALAMEKFVLAQLRAALNGSVSQVRFSVNRVDNIISTQTIRTKLRIQPLAYAKFITNELGFTNPALELS